MRKAAVLMFFLMVLVVLGIAQTATSPAQSGSTASQATSPSSSQPSNQNPPAMDQHNGNSGLGQGGDVPASTEMRATLDTPLSSRTAKPGDRFTATVSQPVQGRNGVAIPGGTRVEGEVSEAEQGKDIPALRGKGTLNLRFRDLVLPNGQTIPLAASLVSVNRTSGRVQKADNESQPESETQGKSVAKDLGTGAGVGKAGPTFGEPLKGLAIGVLPGGGYVLATNRKDVILPAQTGMVIRLDQALNIQ